PGAVGAHAAAAVVGRVEDRAQLVRGEAARAGLVRDAVPAAGEDLDDLDAALDLLSHRLAELVRTVAEALRAEVAESPPVLSGVVVVAGGIEADATGEQTRPLDQPVLDRELQLGVDVVVDDAGRDDAREAGTQGGEDVARRNQHQIAGRLLEPER